MRSNFGSSGRMGKEKDKELSLISPAGGAVTKAIKRNRWYRLGVWAPETALESPSKPVFGVPPQPALHPTPPRFRVPRSGPLSLNKAASLRGFCSNPFPVPARLPSPPPSQRQQGTWQGGCPSLSHSPRAALGFGTVTAQAVYGFIAALPVLLDAALISSGETKTPQKPSGALPQAPLVLPFHPRAHLA